MLKRIVLFSILYLGFALSTSAHASMIYATDASDVVVGSNQGTANGRDDIDNLLGAPDGVFYELGRDGEVTLTFGNPTGQLFSTSGVITEVTFGNVANHPESVEIYLGFEGVFQFLTSVVNTGAQNGIQFFFGGGPFDSIKIVDTTTFSKSGGFDIDSVGVTAVPAPAGIFLLGAGLVLLGLRKRVA